MITAQALQLRHDQGPTLAFPDVHVEQGGVLLLTGPSGCGKSSWLSLVAGLRAVQEGQLIVGGVDLKSLSPVARDRWRAQHLGFVAQRLHLSEALSVADNMALVYYAAGLPVRRADITAALAALDVADLMQRRPSSLSGGQAQRVALARATLLRPQVLLADEPTANLDDEAAAAAMSLLLDSVRRTGATLVVATHDARASQALTAAAPALLQMRLARPAGAQAKEAAGAESAALGTTP